MKGNLMNVLRLKISAENGDAVAQYHLGLCYYNGREVTQDLKRAVKLFQQAVEQGLVEGKANLGWCYKHGVGVTQDLEKAAELYQQASDQKDGALVIMWQR
jgi:hypothetical protein